ncbi:hypothetical protein OIV83_002127 [Microbotryomycetes sp. JL201]|nr:hypothetical protein OIV83_002127 [Microbotryomycetes sp. JL201]
MLPVRHLHAFRPSVVLYKRKKGAHESAATAADELAEFEQDSFDDTVVDEQHDAAHQQTMYSSSSSSGDGASRDALGVSLLSRQERFARYYSVLDAALARQYSDFKSNLPSWSLLANLVKTTGPNDVDRLLDVLERWRRKGLPVNRDTSDLLLRKLSKMQDKWPQLVDVLSNGTKFGLQGLDPRALDKAFVRLTEPAQDSAGTSQTGGETSTELDAAVATQAESANQLVQLERFYLDGTNAPRDPLGPLLTLAPTLIVSNATSQFKADVKNLIDDVKSHGANGLGKFISTLCPTSRNVVKQRLDTIVQELIKANSADARWFKQVISVVEA